MRALLIFAITSVRSRATFVGAMTWRLDTRAVLGLLAVLMVWTLAYLASRWARGVPEVAIAASVDFTITAGLALYVIAVRTEKLPRWTVVATVVAGFALARHVLADTPDLAAVAIALAIVLELAMLVRLAWRAPRAVAAWRSTRARGASLVQSLEAAALAAGFPARLASLLATEVSVIGAAITGWRRPARSPHVFTVHRVNGWPLYAGVLCFLTCVETVAVHIALTAFASSTAAWVASVLSVYSIVWLVGDALALRHGGVLSGEHALELRIGVRWRGEVPWSVVESIELGTPPDDGGAVSVAVLAGNVVVRLREPCRVRGLLGLQRQGTVLVLSVDDPDAFVASARARAAAARAA